MVDWNLAVATATRLVRPGPEVSRDEARAVVAELRRHAKASEEHVRGFTRMGTEDDPRHPGPRRRPARLGPGERRRASGSSSSRCSTRCRNGAAAPPAARSSARSAARSPASSWACCCRSWPPASSASTRPSPRPPASCPAGESGGGRLLLVAPNIVHVERELDVEPARLPALGVPARGDAPHPVHRRALAARPPARARSSRSSGRPRSTPMTVLERIREAAQSLGRRPPRGRGGRRRAAPSWRSCRPPPSARSSAASPP